MVNPVSRLGLAEQRPRPKIVLVYGVHLNEKAVTEYLATKLKQLLEARGFDVEVKEFPKEKTIHALAETKKQINKPLETEELSRLFEDAYLEWKEYMTKLSQNCDFIIDLHNSSTFRDLILKKSKFFSGRAVPVTKFFKSDPTNPLTLYYDEKLKINLVMLEMPAKYKLARYTWQEISHPWHRQSPDYFKIEADLSATIKAGFLSSIVIAKFAHLIDTTVKTRLGIYHTPRTLPFKPKADKETAKRIEMQRKLRRERMRPR